MLLLKVRRLERCCLRNWELVLIMHTHLLLLLLRHLIIQILLLNCLVLLLVRHVVWSIDWIVLLLLNDLVMHLRHVEILGMRIEFLLRNCHLRLPINRYKFLIMLPLGIRKVVWFRWGWGYWSLTFRHLSGSQILLLIIFLFLYHTFWLHIVSLLLLHILVLLLLDKLLWLCVVKLRRGSRSLFLKNFV